MYKERDIIQFIEAKADGLRTSYEYEESRVKCEEHNFPVAKSLGIKTRAGEAFLGTVRAEQTEEGKVFASYIDHNGFEGALYFKTEQIVLVKRPEEVINDYAIY